MDASLMAKVLGFVVVVLGVLNIVNYGRFKSLWGKFTNFAVEVNKAIEDDSLSSEEKERIVKKWLNFAEELTGVLSKFFGKK